MSDDIWDFLNQVRAGILMDMSEGHWEAYGDMGKLMKCFDDLGIPFDIGLVGKPVDEREDRWADVKSYYITIPPPIEEPTRTLLFSFNPNYTFDLAVAENAYPMGYRVAPE